MSERLDAMRKDYLVGQLLESQVLNDPIRQFESWFADATETHEPNAMALGTVDADGRPSVRVVLLKFVDERGFVFFTDYESRKGQALAANPHCSLCFWWPELERQVRVEGQAARVEPELSDKYFASRPRKSQVSAAISRQSSHVAQREDLEQAAAALTAELGAAAVPRPERWGGYRVVPERVEFWQGRASRLHDRLVFTRDGEGWRIERLSP